MNRPSLRSVTAILIGIALFFFVYFVVDLLLLAGISGADEVDGAINIVALALVLLLLAFDLSAPEEAPGSWPTGWPRNRLLRLLALVILFALMGAAVARLLSLLLYEFVRIIALLLFIYHAGKVGYRLSGGAITGIAVVLLLASSFAMDNQWFLVVHDLFFAGSALVLAWRRRLRMKREYRPV